MKDPYELYRMSDCLLKLVLKSADNRFPTNKISKTYKEKKIVELLQANGFATIDIAQQKEMLCITDAGKTHLNSGGYTTMLGLEPKLIEKISFKQLLDESTNLLSIFGILNAIILFATQKQEPSGEVLDLFGEGMQFISISMYLFSILVLIELIQHIFSSNIDSWKVQMYYFLLCTTTLGMGGLFLYHYWPLIAGVGMMFLFMLFVAVIFLCLRWILSKFSFINRRLDNLAPKNITGVMMIVAIIIGGLVVKLIKYLAR